MWVQVAAEAILLELNWDPPGAVPSLQLGSISFYQEKDLVVMIIQICISPRIVSKQQGTETDFEIELLR